MTPAELLASFRGCRVVVLGDLMLDEYVHGRATRISQEAPVMVVRQSWFEAVPGGAANVAANIAALGAEVALAGVVGDDEAGTRLQLALEGKGTGSLALVRDAGRPTTRKTRILADAAHQVLRVDHESDRPLASEAEAQLIEAVRGLLNPRPDVLLLSDYVKGTLTDAVAAFALGTGIPVVANAKPASARRYRDAELVSLNRPETEGIVGRTVEAETAVNDAAEVVTRIGCRHALVTLSGDGMATEAFYVPPVPVEVFDAAGAGDTTIATVALGLASVGFRPEVFELAARLSAAVVRKVGVAVPSAEDLANL